MVTQWFLSVPALSALGPLLRFVHFHLGCFFVLADPLGTLRWHILKNILELPVHQRVQCEIDISYIS